MYYVVVFCKNDVAWICEQLLWWHTKWTLSTRKSQANPQPNGTCILWIREIENRSFIRDPALAVTRETIAEVFFEGILIGLLGEDALQRPVGSGVQKGRRRPTKRCRCRFRKITWRRKHRTISEAVHERWATRLKIRIIEIVYLSVSLIEVAQLTEEIDKWGVNPNKFRTTGVR